MSKRRVKTANPLKRVRQICLALPQATEKLAWGAPTFRAGQSGKMFAMYANNHHDDGRIALWLSSTPEVRAMLIDTDSERFFIPPYQGPFGWVGVRVDLDDVDWDEIAELLKESFRLTASKKLVTLLDPDQSST